MDLDDVVSELDRHHQRASYSAVAGVTEKNPSNVMTGRPRSYKDSWVVASRNGRPTGYRNHQIHPDCLRQISQSPYDFINNVQDLEQWLHDRTGTRS